MQTLEIEEIHEKRNIREELGDLTDLTNSIKVHGILIPLIVDKDKNLIAGHRRLQAAKDAGLDEVPVHMIDGYMTPETRIEAQIIENIQRKDLDPFEEGKAYSDYKKLKKCDVEYMSKQFGKTPDYINRRIKILKAEDNVADALQGRKIEIGHAELLVQMNPDQQKVALKEILDYDLTVQNFADQIRWMKKIDFGDIAFRPRERGGQKSLLSSLGIELDPKDQTANFKTSPKFRQDIAAYLESQRKMLKDKGITVYSSEADLKKKHPAAARFQSWEEGYTTAVKDLPKSKEYAVVVDFEYNGMNKEVYRLVPKVEKKVEKTEKVTAKDTEEAEKMLELTREQKITSRTQEYKHQLLIDLNTKHMTEPGDKIALAMVLHTLLKTTSMNYGYAQTKAEEIMEVYEKKYKKEQFEMTDLSNLMLMTPGEIVIAAHQIARGYVKHLDNDELVYMAPIVGTDLSKEWVIDQEYLEMHTKDQIIDLARDIKMPSKNIQLIEQAGSKGDMIALFLKEELKGKTPKRMKL